MSGDEDFKVRQRMGLVFIDNLCTFIITANTNKYNLCSSDTLRQFSAVGRFGGVPLQKEGKPLNKWPPRSSVWNSTVVVIQFRQWSNLWPLSRSAKLLKVFSEIHTNQTKWQTWTRKKKKITETNHAIGLLNGGFSKTVASTNEESWTKKCYSTLSNCE